jgi:hypothetical protein
MTKPLDITNGDALSSVYALPAVYFESSFDSKTSPLRTDHGVPHGQKTLPVPALRSRVSRAGTPQIFARRTGLFQTDSGRLNAVFSSPISPVTKLPGVFSF